jgi:hypothetical protein
LLRAVQREGGMTMIERVARALLADRGCAAPDNVPLDHVQFGEIALSDARAVIATIEQAGSVIVPRVATRAMREAGYRAMMHTDFTGPQEAACWDAMISSALSETSGGEG